MNDEFVCFRDVKHFIKEIWFPMLWRSAQHLVYQCIIVQGSQEFIYIKKLVEKRKIYAYGMSEKANHKIRTVYVNRTCERKSHILKRNDLGFSILSIPRSPQITSCERFTEKLQNETKQISSHESKSQLVYLKHCLLAFLTIYSDSRRQR